MTNNSYDKLFLYIDREFIEGNDRKHKDIVNPANVEVIGLLPHAGRDDLDRALNAAQRAFQSWRGSIKTAELIVNGLEVGMVKVNHFGITLAETPFGGVKDSGMGSEPFDSYLATKIVSPASPA
jgi:acyl-CoA reductase-like NAD-dependent aldehyde dehydrogenase